MAATKLTSVSLRHVETDSHQQDVVTALAALPHLEQLTWWYVTSGPQSVVSDSALLRQLTQLTALELKRVKDQAMQHLSSLTKLQHIRIRMDYGSNWTASGCPGLENLKALTSLDLHNRSEDPPASISELTALQQLRVRHATPSALNRLQPLSRLTQLQVKGLVETPGDPVPLPLTSLQHLLLKRQYARLQPVSLAIATPFIPCADLTRLQVLKLLQCTIRGPAQGSPGNLVPSTSLQHLELHWCYVQGHPQGANAGPVSWQQVFPGPGQLPHLTSVRLTFADPELTQADIESVVACCSGLRVLHLSDLQLVPTGDACPALARLTGLTCLVLEELTAKVCSSLVQLTGLQELMVQDMDRVETAGWRQLAGLEHLTRLGFERFDPNTDTFSSMPQTQRIDTPRDYPGWDEIWLAIFSKAPPGCPPDVCCQLLEALKG